MTNLHLRKSKITIGDLKKMIENLPNDYTLKYYKRYEFDESSRFAEYADEMSGYENVTDIEIEMLDNACSLNIE